MKFVQGCIANNDGVTKDIIIKSVTPCKPVDLVIGGLLTVTGISYMLIKSFMYGSQLHELTEYETMIDLGIISE